MIPLELRPAKDDSDRKLLSDVETCGSHMVAIEKEDDCPEYIFTVGLYYSFEHPEIAIMGLPRDVMYQFLQDVVHQIQKGKRYSASELDHDLASFPIAFRDIDISRYRDYLGYAVWFYTNLPAPFPALQFVWPDKGGYFPWDEDYDKRFLSLQHLLYTEKHES
jgi:hypothetical protein